MLGRRLAGHGERAAQLAQGLAVLLVQPVEQRTPGGVGQRLEHQVQVVGHAPSCRYLPACQPGRYGRRMRSSRRSTTTTSRGTGASSACPGWSTTHVHFLPERVQTKVWRYFDEGTSTTASHWPVAYALPGRRAAGDPGPARRAGVPDAALPAQAGHGGLAQRLVGGVRRGHPRIIQSATFYPEPEAPFYVAEALEAGCPHVQGARAGRRLRPAQRRCSTRCGGGWRRPGRRWSSTAARVRCSGEHTGPGRCAGCCSAIPGCSW